MVTSAWLDPNNGHPCYGGESWRHSYTDGVCEDCGAEDPEGDL